MVFVGKTLENGHYPMEITTKKPCVERGPGSPVQWLQVEAPEDQIPLFFWDEHIDTIYIYMKLYTKSYNYIYYIISNNNIVYISYIIL